MYGRLPPVNCSNNCIHSQQTKTATAATAVATTRRLPLTSSKTTLRNSTFVFPLKRQQELIMKVFSSTTTHFCFVTSPLLISSSSSAFGASSSSATTSVSSTWSRMISSWGLQQPSQRSITSSTSDSSTQIMALKKEAPFPTWTFDKPCPTMEWSPLSHITLDVSPTAAVAEGTSTVAPAVLDADLVIVSVTAPPTSKEDEEKEEDDTKKDESDTKEVPVVPLDGPMKVVDDATGGILTEILTESNKTFKNGSKAGSMSPTVRVRTATEAAATTKRYALLGLGSPTASKDESKEDTNGEWTTGIGFSIGKALSQQLSSIQKVSTVHVLLPATILSNSTIVRDIVTCLYSELHVDNRYRTGDRIKKVAEQIQSVTFVSIDASMENVNDVTTAMEAGRKLANGIILTKDIVNAPHNVLNSQSLADTAKRIAKDLPQSIKCTILGKKECEQRNMGAYLGVARGSETEPQFIHLTYTPPGGSSSTTKKIAVIGKGLLFDTGGYNIKTAMMEMMKFDCGGAAAVLGAARAIGTLQPPNVEVHFIVAACENMINDRAMVPSDILTASNGKTIEVMNTDAEGRLTLADALVYADKELDCESIVELSTLTGACMVALGKSVSAVYTANDALANELADISKVTGDKSWRMPLEKEYNEQLESKFADLKNIGGKYGGSITAALFLQHFVSKKKPFAHIDIAGPVWSDKNGATGYGTKLLVEWITRQGLK